MRIKEIINTILWKYRNSLKDFTIVIVDRLSPSGFKHIGFEHVKYVNNNYLYISTDHADVIAIPLHRVIRVEKKDGEIVWSRT